MCQDDPHLLVEAKIRLAMRRWAGGASLDAIRSDFEALLHYPVRGHGTAFKIGDMEAIRIDPVSAGAGAGTVIVYCHGGGYQIGSIKSHRSLMFRLSDAARCPVIGFNYRLAPEHRFPAAREDALSAYRWLLDQGYSPEQIAIAGDSAGGALATHIALDHRGAGAPRPAALALISPWLDLSMSGGSYVSRAGLDIFSKPEQLHAMVRSYAGATADTGDPRLSPLFDDLSQLPPTLIHAGDFDITLDDSTAFAAKAASSGADVELKVWDRMYHHFQVFEELPEARASLTEIGRFLNRHLAQ